jgi:hypothetical protein
MKSYSIMKTKIIQPNSFELAEAILPTQMNLDVIFDNENWDDFVPLAYNGQGGNTDVTVKVVPPASRAGGGGIKTKRKEKGIRMDFDKSRQ